ncbi:4Fe-4S dicluster domain-containing protein [Desulfosporosinus sp. FKB]|uniref:4Fe-4S dicluster domain-containing protein n=1 Tax=Desulfosporosinus sp. FKB TaxID=1969835 RepID=UPI000B49B10F|nr:4Fe-4S dicluster domain-containing protein [Desulfosporosinus sp. FKB]
MNKQLGFLHNSEKCVGCRGCEMACKNLYQTDISQRWRQVFQIDENAYPLPSRMFISIGCNHCSEPQCMKVCPVGAYTKRDDGIVIHDDNRCIGCRLCVMACPYGRPQFNSVINIVQKCNLCYQRVDKGEKPACVASCVAGALELVQINSSLDAKTGVLKTLPGLPSPSITNPSIRFVGPKQGKQVRRD